MSSTKPFRTPYLGESSLFFLPMVLLSFSYYNYVSIVPHCQLLESWDWVLFIFVSLQALTQGLTHLWEERASDGSSGPYPHTCLFPLAERGQIEPHSQDASASPVHLGSLWWPPVQGSSYLNKSGIYRMRSCTPGNADTKVSRDVRQALGR